MDTIELEKAEGLPHPSLVGSSIRLADDLEHQNYIHPTKGQKSLRTPLIKREEPIRGTLLDDLQLEGALLTDNDYEFMNSNGEVMRAPPVATEEITPLEQQVAALAINLQKNREAVTNDSEFKHQGVLPVQVDSNDSYSTPNLSQYQLEHNIVDHGAFVKSVQSQQNPAGLPGYSLTAGPPRLTRSRSSQPQPPTVNVAPVGVDGLHSPYFYTEREQLRSRAAEVSRDRSRLQLRLRLTNKPHLARGDNYKSIHGDTPSGYELPANLEPPVEENDRVTRQGKRTMSEKILQAELVPSVTPVPLRSYGLVTTGDYTNFNADHDYDNQDSGKLLKQRELTLASYLRLILRSRSRPATTRRDVAKDEADPSGLYQEGALVNDDPYGQFDSSK